MIVKEFEKAVVSLELALSHPKTDMNRDATIQRFKYAIELSWKTGKRLMGTSLSSPKEVVREMGRVGLINDVEFWLDALDDRNLVSHTYKELMAERVYKTAKKFCTEARTFFLTLQTRFPESV